MSLYHDERKQPTRELENQKELKPPKRFDSREQWEQWKRGSFKSEAEFRAWQERDRKGDLPHLQRAIPQTALAIVYEKGQAAAAGVAQRDPETMRYIKDPQLQHFLHSYGQELGYHAVNPAFRDKPGAQAVWGATNFALNEKFRPRVDAIARAQGVDLSDLDQGQVVEQIDGIIEHIKNNPGNRVAGGRLSRENRQAISVLTNFRRRYNQGLKTQALKAKELWELSEIPRGQRPGYVETASKNNISGVAVSFREEMTDTDGDGTKGYAEHIARVRARSGAGLERSSQSLLVTTKDEDFRSGSGETLSAPPVPGRAGSARVRRPASGDALPTPPRRFTDTDFARPRELSVDTAPQTPGSPGRAPAVDLNALVARSRQEERRSQNEQRRTQGSGYEMPAVEFRYWKGQLDKGFKLPFSAEQAVSFLSARSAIGSDQDTDSGDAIGRLEHARRGFALLSLEYQQGVAQAREQNDSKALAQSERALASLKPLELSLGLSLNRSRRSGGLASQIEQSEQGGNSSRLRPSSNFAERFGVQSDLRSGGLKESSAPETSLAQAAPLAEQSSSSALETSVGDTSLQDRANRWFASFRKSAFANDPEASRKALERFLHQGKVTPEDLLSMSSAMRRSSDPSARGFADLLRTVSGLA